MTGRLPDVGVAVQAFIYRNGSWLFFERPGREGWSTLAGKLKAGEDVDAGLLREIGEELGPDVRVEVLRTVDAHTWDQPPYGRLVSVFKLVRYLGGEIRLASDLADARFAWFATGQLSDLAITVPRQRWIVDWAVRIAGWLGDSDRREGDDNG